VWFGLTTNAKVRVEVTYMGSAGRRVVDVGTVDPRRYAGTVLEVREPAN
jgi:hypothetical protein